MEKMMVKIILYLIITFISLLWLIKIKLVIKMILMLNIVIIMMKPNKINNNNNLHN